VDKYFLDSASNISFFLEEKAGLDDEGQLNRPKELCVNKAGHGASRVNGSSRGIAVQLSQSSSSLTGNGTKSSAVSGFPLFKPF
jgi:hypothetical protein